jgi:Na+/H+ antiporter NhaC
MGLIYGFNLIDLFTIGGEGISSVGELIVITLLAAGMLGMIKTAGGIDFILKVVGRNIKSSRGAQMSIALLVGIVNLCTANNTVAIITVGSLAKKISTHYNVTPRKSASLLDTGSCIVQALIPYGAQTLMAASLAGISPVAPWPYLFYPQLLILFLIISIIVKDRRK